VGDMKENSLFKLFFAWMIVLFFDIHDPFIRSSVGAIIVIIVVGSPLFVIEVLFVRILLVKVAKGISVNLILMLTKKYLVKYLPFLLGHWSGSILLRIRTV
jgi:hypothetical protein